MDHATFHFVYDIAVGILSGLGLLVAKYLPTRLSALESRITACEIKIAAIRGEP